MNDQSSTLLQAVRGPVMLITIGTLFALDQYSLLSFSRSWPAILIVLGLLSLGQWARRRSE